MSKRPPRTWIAPALAATLGIAGAQPVVAAGPAAGPRLSIDVRRDRHAISADIYGVNFADTTAAKRLGITVDRWGGNSTTRYNPATGFHNTGSDWYFENIPPDPGKLPHVAFIEGDRAAGLRTVLTVPLIGWTPRAGSSDEHPFACAFPAARFPQQDSFDPYDANCGNGLHNGAALTGNSPSATSSAFTPAWVGGWIHDLVTAYGSASSGGVHYVELDNEPTLWNSTHRDVHPLPLTYQELLDRTIAYASAVKSADPGAKTLGPSDWGWCAYLYSAADPGGCSAGADRQAHGDQAFVPWYLAQLQAWQAAHGTRLLDLLDEHYYPQSGVALRDAGNAATQALRLRATRSLWDPSYKDESWISDLAPGGVAVRLIPRLHDWVNASYPGTGLALTEYNFGGLESINGALAQADVLGIFGREGLDLATLWDAGSADQPWAFAFRMYRNSDGHGAQFGTTSVRARSFDSAQASRVNGGQDRLSIYAALRSNGALTVMVINKTGAALRSKLSLKGFSAAAKAQVWRYSGANRHAIVHPGDATVASSAIRLTYPARSITLLVVPRR